MPEREPSLLGSRPKGDGDGCNAWLRPLLAMIDGDRQLGKSAASNRSKGLLCQIGFEAANVLENSCWHAVDSFTTWQS